jgi:deoxyribodipyrimidine photo-lyase
MSNTYNTRDLSVVYEIKEWAGKNGIEFEAVENSTLYKIEDLPFSIDDMPEGFSSFRRKIEKKNLEFNEVQEYKIPKAHSIELKDVKTLFKKYKNIKKNEQFKGGEGEAFNRLHDYLWKKERAKTYKETRNGMIDFDDSTKFSPWLSLGCISPITIMKELLDFEEKIERNESTYWIYFELLWREYFKFYCLKYGDKVFSLNGLGKKAFKIKDSANQKELFDLWKNGKTKEPFVNANMIELLKTGWMSNRGRQNVASYLSKHLCVDWRWGAEWFETHLIDYDVESNWGNWNYNAGVGTDPRDRIFNIKRQAEMYDPFDEYQKKWLE